MSPKSNTSKRNLSPEQPRDPEIVGDGVGASIDEWRSKRNLALGALNVATLFEIATSMSIKGVTAKSKKAELVTAVLAVEERVKAMQESDIGHSPVEVPEPVWPPSTEGREATVDVSMNVLAETLERKLAISRETSRSIVMLSGLETVDDLAALDAEACREIASQASMSIAGASKLRSLVQGYQVADPNRGAGAFDGGAATSGHRTMKPQGTLSAPPRYKDGDRWTDWFTRWEDWRLNAEERHFPPSELYAKLRDSFPETTTAIYFRRYSDKAQRNLDTLLDFLKERLAGWVEIDHREEVALFRKCKRRGRDMKVFRTEWEGLREGCLAKGLIHANEPDAHWALLEAAELSQNQTKDILTGHQKLHSRPNGATSEELVRETLAQFKLMEQTWELMRERGGRQRDGAGGNKRNTAFFTQKEIAKPKANKGKGKGQNQKKAKGKGKGKGGKAEKPDCKFGARCTRADCWFKHPPGWKPSTKGAGKGQNGKGQEKGAGKKTDWKCPACGANVFGSKAQCFKCQTPRPSVGGNAQP